MRYRYFCILTLLVLHAGVACAQQIHTRHFSVNDGLAHNRVYSMFCDRYKYLWLCTDNGLSRYDGARFVNYYPRDAAGSNYVLGAALLNDGRMLVSAYKGGLCFFRNGSFSPVVFDAATADTLAANVPGILTLYNDSSNHCVWAINAAGVLLKLHIRNDTVSLAANWQQSFFSNATVDARKCRVYFAAADGLYEYDGKNINPVPGIQGPVFYIQQAKDILLLGMPARVAVYNTGLRRTERVLNFSGRADTRTFLYDTVSNLLWIPQAGSGVKAYRLDADLTPVLDMLKGVNVNALITDELGNTWCGSYGAGLYQLSGNSIVNYSGTVNFADNYITHISGNRNGTLNVSFLQSVYEFSPLTGRFSLLMENELRNPHNKCVPLDDGTRAFSKKSSWLAGKREITSANRTLVYDMLQTGAASYAVGTFSGLVYHHYTAGGVHTESRILPRVRTHKITRCGDSLLLATSEGLYIVTPSGTVHIGVKEGLLHKFLYEARKINGVIYCAGRDGVSLVLSDGRVRPYTTLKPGQTDVTGICEDNAGGIWFAASGGLYFDDGRELFFFDETNGLIASEVTAVYAAGGQLYAGTPAGLSVLNTAEVRRRQPGRHTLRAEHILINGSQTRLLAPYISLEAAENNITIPIEGADFNHPRLRILEYSLNGGQNWTAITNREIALQSLVYGKYHVLVRTRLRHESAFTTLADFWLHISVPWYRNVIFILALSLLVLGLFGWLVLRSVRIRNRKARQELAVQQQVLDLKQKAMAALLNPHFVFNAINSINYYIHNGEEEKYTLLLTDLSRLIRLNLNNTYKDAVSLASELEILDLYVAFEKHRFIRQPLSFSIHNSSSHDAAAVLIPSMMLQPFVENAIWHGVLPQGGGSVWIDITDSPGKYICITVSDSGKGWDMTSAAAAPGVRGIGLIQERIQAYNRLNSQPILLSFHQQSGGFSVQLLFPLQHQPEKP